MSLKFYCHTCEKQLYTEIDTADVVTETEIYSHLGHVIEPHTSMGVALRAPRRVFVAYNVWDSEVAWQFSLRSISLQVDGVIAVVGPYKGWQSDRNPDEIAADMRDTLQANIPKGMPVEWIYKPVWESQIDKRNAYLKCENFKNIEVRPGDYLLILDDDEILLTKDRDTLRSIMMFAMERAINIMVHRPEIKITTKVPQTVEQILKEYRKDPYAGHHLSLQVVQRGYRSERDAVFATRLIAWVPGLQYYENHFTLIEPVEGDKYRQVIPTVKLWAITIGHSPHLRSMERMYKRINFYVDRTVDEGGIREGERPSHFGREL